MHEIGLAGGSAIGLSGKDDNLVRCTQMDAALGLVGEPVLVNTELLENLLDMNLTPVVAPIGVGLEGDANTYNVNADVSSFDGFARHFNSTQSVCGADFNCKLCAFVSCLFIHTQVAASVIAKQLGASRLLLLTDVPGVLDANKKLLASLDSNDVKTLIADGVISGGMIPKVEMAVDAAEGGVSRAVIIDGRIEHAVLINLLGKDQKAGTSFEAA